MTDAHNHLQDSRFDGLREGVIATMRYTGIQRCVVNGTRPTDWSQVAALADKHPDLVIPSFGLHPWYAHQTTEHPDWLDQLTRFLDITPHAGIGECGLDRWIKGYDIELQSGIFIAQLKLAAERNLPLSIHCVRAWGMLIEILESHPLPARGFLLHSYGGSAELIPRLTKLGAYFSFSGSLFHPNNQNRQNIFQQVPADRLLIETDAPDMLPPEQLIKHPLQKQLNHPANLHAIFENASSHLETSSIHDNFSKLFQNNT